MADVTQKKRNNKTVIKEKTPIFRCFFIIIDRRKKTKNFFEKPLDKTFQKRYTNVPTSKKQVGYGWF